MKNKKVVFAISFMLVFAFIVNSHAGLVSVVETGGALLTDLYDITFDPTGASVQEDYGGDTIIIYNGGYAAVATDEGSPLFFDKIVTFDFTNPAQTSQQQTTWKITNTSENIIWTDYHFQITAFHLKDAVDPPGLDVFFTDPANSSQFKGVNLADDMLDFFYDPPGGKVINPGESFEASFRFGFSGVSTGNQVEVWIQQVATTPIPEPATMLLVGSGLLGLAGFGRRKFFKK